MLKWLELAKQVTQRETLFINNDPKLEIVLGFYKMQKMVNGLIHKTKYKIPRSFKEPRRPLQESIYLTYFHCNLS